MVHAVARLLPRAAAWLLAFSTLLQAPLAAADGDLDPTFSSDGKATVLWQESGETYNEASSVAALPDGALVLGGTLLWVPPSGITFDWVFVKLTNSGIVDTGWGESGRRRIGFDLIEGGGDRLFGLFAEPDGSVYAVGSTDNGGDGKILVAGTMNATGAQTGGFFLGRLDAEGQPDLTFDDNGVARYEFDRTTNGKDVALAVVLSGGKPVAAGYALDAADESDMAILRVSNSYLFADGFEAGHTLLWTAGAP